MRTMKTLFRLHACADRFESSLGAHSRGYVFSCCGSMHSGKAPYTIRLAMKDKFHSIVRPFRLEVFVFVFIFCLSLRLLEILSCCWKVAILVKQKPKI